MAHPDDFAANNATPNYVSHGFDIFVRLCVLQAQEFGFGGPPRPELQPTPQSAPKVKTVTKPPSRKRQAA